MSSKAKTIKNLPVEDCQYIDDLAFSMGIPVPEAVTYIIKKAKEAVNNTGKQQENEVLQAKIQELEKSIVDFTEQIKVLQEENEVLKNTPPQTIEKFIDKPVEVPIQLTETQFICELPKETIVTARRLRKFIKEDGHVSKDVADENFPSELINVCLKQFIKRNYSDIVNL